MSRSPSPVQGGESRSPSDSSNSIIVLNSHEKETVEATVALDAEDVLALVSEDQRTDQQHDSEGSTSRLQPMNDQVERNAARRPELMSEEFQGDNESDESKPFVSDHSQIRENIVINVQENIADGVSSFRHCDSPAPPLLASQVHESSESDRCVANEGANQGKDSKLKSQPPQVCQTREDDQHTVGVGIIPEQEMPSDRSITPQLSDLPIPPSQVKEDTKNEQCIVNVGGMSDSALHSEGENQDDTFHTDVLGESETYSEDIDDLTDIEKMPLLSWEDRESGDVREVVDDVNDTKDDRMTTETTNVITNVPENPARRRASIPVWRRNLNDRTKIREITRRMETVTDVMWYAGGGAVSMVFINIIFYGINMVPVEILFSIIDCIFVMIFCFTVGYKQHLKSKRKELIRKIRRRLRRSARQ